MNVILLPKQNFKTDISVDGKLQHTAIITEPKSIVHVNKILKLNIHDRIKIGQLGGKLGVANIAHIGDTVITLDNVMLTQQAPPKLGISVILALPRPKVLRRLIMDMTALGVNDIILVNSSRTQKSYWQSPLLERVPEFVLEGLQQAVDTIAPNIHIKKRLRPFIEDELGFMLNRMNGQQHAYQRHDLDIGSFERLKFYPMAIVAHPYVNNELISLLSSIHQHEQANLPKMIAIGAEGGWVDFEIELFKQQGFIAMRHGQRILRTEAAVNVILGSLMR